MKYLNYQASDEFQKMQNDFDLSFPFQCYPKQQLHCYVQLLQLQKLDVFEFWPKNYDIIIELFICENIML